MNRRDYPANWDEISYAIRYVRARHRCEWCGACEGDQHPVTGSTVMLTVAHLGVAWPDGRPGDKADKSDCRPENLAALCQRCHLTYDLPEHMLSARRTLAEKRARARAAAGQLSLFDSQDVPTELVTAWLTGFE